jgi:hypothetical protein
MAGPITVAYYHRVRWGGLDEFLELFERNHWPILREHLAAGLFLDVRAATPRFHGDGRADWDFLIITDRSRRSPLRGGAFTILPADGGLAWPA